MYSWLALRNFTEQAALPDCAKRAIRDQCGTKDFSAEEMIRVFRGYEHLIMSFMRFAETPESKRLVRWANPHEPMIIYAYR